jgi:hypothetical protein
VSESVTLYEVLADGYHTPLTETQIAKLFQAGRIGRNQPCKQVARKEWRTIDELFPLLKYDSSGQFFSQSAQSNRRTLDRALAVVAAVFVIAVGLLAFYFYLRSDSHGSPGANIREATAGPSSRANTNPAENNTLTNSTKPADSNYSDTSSLQARLAQERLDARRQRELQAVKLAQDRTDAARRELAQQKAAGRNEIVPLDQFTFIPDVGGSGVTVKIHDNDVTSFDVLINGSLRRQVSKQKGNTGSRTDETLIYQNGRARLYYVWEISGKLNSCLLRVREE